MQEHLNVTVIPMMGNHEPYPVNVYDYMSDREKPLLEGFSKVWEKWIGAEAAKFHAKNGFYSTVIPKMNLKVIAMNSQACNGENWYLLREPTDPGNQLQWIRAELYDAERRNLSVYIISHIHPLSCLSDWVDRYNILIDRFSHIIRGQFFGHSHNDHF